MPKPSNEIKSEILEELSLEKFVKMVTIAYNFRSIPNVSEPETFFLLLIDENGIGSVSTNTALNKERLAALINLMDELLENADELHGIILDEDLDS